VQGGADAGAETGAGRRGGLIESLIINVLLTLMAVLVLAIIGQRNLFAVVVLSGIYSFLMATVLVALDAVDVAMTEAAVGAGISTVLFLGALHLTRGDETRPLRRSWTALLVAFGVGGALVYGALDLPAFSDPAAPIHTHVVPRYLEQGEKETGVPNVVTAVLASYRGFDTLGETTVVFTAGIGVIALLRRRRKNREEG
jgi:multicomponent Na+:H+ antiporter subunit B